MRPVIADVRFGDLNPGGKLPFTFPRRRSCALYYNYKNGRPTGANNNTPPISGLALDAALPSARAELHTVSPLNLQLSARRVARGASLTVSVEVENTGRRAGDEVVQLYLRDVASSVTRPVRELKGFERVALRPGERRRVAFTLAPEHLGFYDREMRFRVEPGALKAFVGTRSVGGMRPTSSRRRF